MVSSVSLIGAKDVASLNCKNGSRRLMSSDDDLPYHLVVGMPALSPTMESGTIASWKLGEGDSFGAGDSLAEIETDKATIDFEAQDDGVIAKIIMPAGSADVPVGTPIVITVEEEDDVAAFANYVVPAEEVAPAAPEPVAAAPEPTPPPVKEVVTPPPVVAATPPPPPPPPAEPVVEVAASTDTVASTSSSDPLTVGPAWGNLARVQSPLAEALSNQQKEYIEKYGSTGQIPL